MVERSDTTGNASRNACADPGGVEDALTLSGSVSSCLATRGCVAVPRPSANCSNPYRDYDNAAAQRETRPIGQSVCVFYMPIANSTRASQFNAGELRAAEIQAIKQFFGGVALVQYVIMDARHTVFDQINRLLASVIDTDAELRLFAVSRRHGVGQQARDRRFAHRCDPQRLLEIGDRQNSWHDWHRDPRCDTIVTETIEVGVVVKQLGHDDVRTRIHFAF